MSKYRCPCGVLLDSEKLLEKLGFNGAMNVILAHNGCVEKYGKPGEYEKDAETTKE